MYGQINQSTFSKAKLLHAVTVKSKDYYVSFLRKCLFDDSSNVTTGNGSKLRAYHTFYNVLLPFVK